MRSIGLAAIGAVLTLIANSLWNVFVENRRHNLELKRRYFDAKLSCTLAFVREWQVILEQARGMFKALEFSCDLPAGISNVIIQETVQKASKVIEDTMDETRRVSRTIEFFYGDSVSQVLRETDAIGETLASDIITVVLQVAVMQWCRSQKLAGNSDPTLDKIEHEMQDKAKKRISTIIGKVEDINSKIRDSLEVFRDEFRRYRV